MHNYKIPSVIELIKQTENGNNKFSFISLFAGGGGSSTGYRMGGGKALVINEFIPEAIETYKSNWPTTKIIGGDIREITAEDLLKASGMKKGDLDLLDGSPPCSAFSTAGNRDKGWGKTKKYSDSSQTNVEDLFFDYVRMVDGIQPKVFVAENVSGLVKGKAKGYFNQILRELKACGYHVEARVLDARWLGVPQSRARLIFVGVRNDLWKDEYKDQLHPLPHKNIVTLEQAFKGLVFTDTDREETDISKYAVYTEMLKLKKGEQSEKYFSLVRSSPKLHCGCLTASAGNSGAASVKHWDNRAFTVNECKRIMSIPDDYVLTGTYSQRVERLGRMVTPFMYKELSKNLIDIGVL